MRLTRGRWARQSRTFVWFLHFDATMDETGFTSINGWEIEELQQFSISCFGDVGGLSSSCGIITGSSASVEREKVSLFHFKREADQYLLRTADGRYFYAYYEGWSAVENVPEEESRVTVEQDDQYPALVRLKWGDNYVFMDWIKCSYGEMRETEDKAEATLFYLNTTETYYGETIKVCDKRNDTTGHINSPVRERKIVRIDGIDFTF